MRHVSGRCDKDGRAPMTGRRCHSFFKFSPRERVPLFARTIMSSATANRPTPPGARPSPSKRQRPCDRCRGKKLGCQTDNGPPCRRCQREGVHCTFLEQPHKRSRPKVQLVPHVHMNQVASPSANNEREVSLGAAPQLQNHSPSAPTPPTQPLGDAVPLGDLRVTRETESFFPIHRETSQLQDAGPSTQFSQSLDQVQNHSAQLFGGSAESDPWLLRHCRFDEYGMRIFHKVHFRNAGGVPTNHKIPVHFMFSANDLHGSAKEETTVHGQKDFRAELNLLVPPGHGPRLVKL